MSECAVPVCNLKAKTHGLCNAHAERARRGVDLSTPVKRRVPFDRQYEVNPQTGCWEWTGYLNENGYGRYSGRYAHRVSYQRSVGPIPDGFHVDHLCRNTRCINPQHLEAVTPRVNMLRSDAPAAIVYRTGYCIRGHERTPENVYIRPNGTKRCRVCHRERQWRVSQEARRAS